jgi:putative transposase
VSRYIDEHRGRFGVEPICRTLGVSASAYYQRRTGERSRRAVEDERLVGLIGELHAQNYYAYGYRRMWKALGRAGEPVARCTVQRLMREHGVQGAKRRGKPWRTTKPEPEARRRPDLVERNFAASGPDRLWVADLSYLRCWEGLVFFAFVIDAFSRLVVGWQLASHMRTTLVLDALRMALGQRQPGADVALVHHSDRGSQYTSIDYAQELNDHGVLASVGTIGDAYDNALAESFVDSFKTELVADRVWRSRPQLELAVVEYVGWFNHQRLHEALGDMPPAEFEGLHAAGKALEGPIPGDRSVAPVAPGRLERLRAARISPAELDGGRNGPDPGRSGVQAVADASLRSPSGLAPLAAGDDPTTLP